MSTPSWAPSRTSFSTSERKVMRTMPRRAGGWLKRSFDVVTSLVLLVLLSPLLLLCGAAVWVADGWPVLFRHERVRRYGRRFHIVKFRTMDHTGGGDLTVAGDPRVTPTGRLLRRHKLDELPQLWNVLVGEMSFVGPRPEVARYVAMYARPYRTIHQLRPGITDFASLAFRDEEQLLYAHTADAGFYERVLLPRKLALARLYRRRYSWWLDARLMLATICTAPGLDSVATLLMGPVLARRARAGLNGAPPRSPASGTDRGNGSGGTGSRQAGDVGWTEVVAAADGR